MDVIVDERLIDFINSLTRTAKARCRQEMGLLESEGKSLGMPHSKKISPKLWELRIRGDHEVRLLYGITKSRAYLVHGFIKKSNKTPKKEIDTAVKRLYNLK